MKLWAKVIKEEKITHNLLFQNELPLTRENYETTLMDICKELDVDTPVTLLTHYRYLYDFNLAKYLPRDFVDKVDFTLFTIENAE